MKPTELQQAIIDAFAAGHSFAVKAVAGAGKTSTIAMAWRACPKPGLALAFNKRNAEDLSTALPKSATCMTLNGFGHRAWIRAFRATLDQHKCLKLAEELNHELAWDIAAAVSLLKANLLVPPGSQAPATPGYEARAMEVLGNSDLDVPLEAATAVLRQSIRMAYQGRIDYDDQIYMTVITGTAVPAHPLVVIDEAQDLTPAQQELVRRAVGKTGQLVVVGDPCQAIYAWRGASRSSFYDLSTGLPILPLSESFRLPKAVARVAQRYVPELRPRPEAPEGQVLTSSPILPGDTVIARTNRVLIAQAYVLLRNGLLPDYRGRNFLRGLKRLLKRYPTYDAARAWADTAANETQQDQAASLMTIFEVAARESLTPDQALARLSAEGTVVLSTIHRAKGLEWPRVHVIEMPTSDVNLAYVAVTRAKDTLITQS